jgi:hypothetical protein
MGIVLADLLRFMADLSLLEGALDHVSFQCNWKGVPRPSQGLEFVGLLECGECAQARSRTGAHVHLAYTMRALGGPVALGDGVVDGSFAERDCTEASVDSGSALDTSREEQRT